MYERAHYRREIASPVSNLVEEDLATSVFFFFYNLIQRQASTMAPDHHQISCWYREWKSFLPITAIVYHVLSLRNRQNHRGEAPEAFEDRRELNEAWFARKVNRYPLPIDCSPNTTDILTEKVLLDAN